MSHGGEFTNSGKWHSVQTWKVTLLSDRIAMQHTLLLLTLISGMAAHRRFSKPETIASVSWHMFSALLLLFYSCTLLHRQ